MLEGYVLVLLGARTLIGRFSDLGNGMIKLSPVYEAHVQFEMDGRGNFGIFRECVPLVGSATLSTLELPAEQCAVIRCEDLSHKEREHWSGAMRKAEDLCKAIRTAESGIVVAPANAQILGNK